MSKNWMCFFGFHFRDIYKILDITDPTGRVLQQVIINRCTNCGNLLIKRVDLTYQVSNT